MKILTWVLLWVSIVGLGGCLKRSLQISSGELMSPSIGSNVQYFSEKPASHSSLQQSVAKTITPWSSYFSTQDTAVEWANSVRGVGRGQTGMKGSDTAPYIQTVSSSLLLIKNILLPVGGLDAGRGQLQVNTFMGQMVHDRGLAWQETVYKQAIALTKVPGGSSRIAWQVGNEINSKRMSETLQTWANEANQTPSANADWVIPYYIEYYLAPTVEAIRKASQERFGSDNEIPVVLGSIANAYNPKSQRWLNALLDYRVKGTYAPSLTHQSVCELVNTLSIHYLVSNSDQNWQQSLDGIWNRWAGQGRIKGLWSTEEIGKKRGMRGQGASTALKVTARYLHWWGLRGISPEAGRVSFWGWKLGHTPGTSANDGMQALYKFLGRSALQEISQGFRFKTNAALESYLFQSRNNPNKRIAFIFPQKDDQSSSKEEADNRKGPDSKAFSINTQDSKLPQTLLMKSQEWQNQVDATAQVFSTQGIRIVPVSVNAKGNFYELSFPKSVDLADQAVALIFLNRQQ